MLCPFCQTENREDRERCYACDKDISMLRLIINKARHHYNVALEHAERGRIVEAIDELKNSIDLDRRFPPAHVVLGTLHAKEGNFDAARESWNTALALQPELTKAHTYLKKVESVEHSLPLLARLRVAGGVLLLIGVIVAILLVRLLQESSAAAPLRLANEELKARRYGPAFEHLAEAKAKALPGSFEDAAAEALASSLRLEVGRQIRRIQDLKYTQDYPEVLEAVNVMESRRPDALTSAVLANIREDVAHYFRTEVQTLFRRFQSGEVSYDEFTEQLGKFLKLYPDVPERGPLVELRERAGDIEAGRRTEQLIAEFGRTGEVVVARERLRGIAEDFGSTPEVERLRNEAVDAVLSALFDAFQLRVNREEFEDARRILGAIMDVADETSDVVNMRGPIELAQRVLDAGISATILREAEQAIVESRPDDAQLLLTILDTGFELSDAERTAADGLYTRLDQAADARKLEWLRARRTALLAGSTSDSDTTRALDISRSLVSFLTSPHDKAEAALLGAAAAARLGDRSLAEIQLSVARQHDPAVLSSGASTSIQRLIRRYASEPAPRPARR